MAALRREEAEKTPEARLPVAPLPDRPIWLRSRDRSSDSMALTHSSLLAHSCSPIAYTSRSPGGSHLASCVVWHHGWVS